MKKFLALLLVLCTVIGLVACGKKPADNAGNPTTPTGGSTTNPSGDTTDVHLTVTPETSPYKGKKLQLYGFNPEDLTDYKSFGKGNYLWMMRAAMDEWAAINGATIEYKGSYNANTVLADMQAGGGPDLVFQSNFFPSMANSGITTAFTQDEYNKLAAVTNSKYLDLMNYNGASHGFVVPWVGNSMLYYNKTMFENYGVKTPKEYFDEGQWNWTNYTKCCEEMTKDLDSDGVIDTYGIPEDSAFGVGGFREDPATGKLVSEMDRQYVFDTVEWRYNLYAKGYVLSPGKNQIATNVIYPMYAMQISDCEPYNFEHLYQSLPNSDELEVVPTPTYDGKDTEYQMALNFTQSAFSMIATCDERDAAVDLMVYVLKVGQKYMSDFSLGAYKCDYFGMQGKCDLSKQWIEAFQKVCDKRAKDLKKVSNYDENLVAKIYEQMDTRTWTMYRPYAGVKGLHHNKEIVELPPASSIPVLKQKLEAQLTAYNNTYVK